MLCARAATLPADWQHQQSFDVTATGLVKFSLPVETLDAARPGLEDLRVYDDAGAEVPYLTEHPMPAPRIVRNAKSFQTSLNPQNTVVTLETGITNPINTVALETPANNFIKSVSVEGSADGRAWRPIVQSKPIFRQPNGMSELGIGIPPAAWVWLRLTVDDQRSQPVPFTGAHLQAASGASAPDEPVTVSIGERHETPGETRLTLNLGAANLMLSQVQIETPEPLFKRQVTIAVPQIREDSIREQAISSGELYRVTLEGQIASQNLSLGMENQVGSRDLLMLIQNNDSPPLPITAVRAMRRPVYLVFSPKQSGTYHLATGNARCAAPRYDLAGLAGNLKSIAVVPVKCSPLSDNPAYHPPEVLADVQDNGPPLDVASWQFRKPIKISRAGPQQLELDTDVLSNARQGLWDLRVLRDGKQVPYILERTSISREIAPEVTVTNDSHISRWKIKLPRAYLPVSRLACEDGGTIFQREMTLYVQTSDERGEEYMRVLNQDIWTQTPDHKGKKFTLDINNVPNGDTFYLQTDNGDNPPVEFGKFRLYYPVTRVLFKAKAGDLLHLYYGEPQVSAPRYDLSLVANELLAADKATASLGAEEELNKATYRVVNASGKGGMLFWGILALVVVALLVVIARLLPKSDSQPPK
jgi:hypothetical protein